MVQTIQGGGHLGRVTDTQMNRGVSVYGRCTIGALFLYVTSLVKVEYTYSYFDCITTFEELLHRTSIKGGAYTHVHAA